MGESDIQKRGFERLRIAFFEYNHLQNNLSTSNLGEHFCINPKNDLLSSLEESCDNDTFRRLETFWSEHLIHQESSEIVFSMDVCGEQKVLRLMIDTIFERDTLKPNLSVGSLQDLTEIIGFANSQELRSNNYRMHRRLLGITSGYFDDFGDSQSAVESILALLSKVSDVLNASALVFFKVDENGQFATRVNGFSQGTPYELGMEYRAQLKRLDLSLFADAGFDLSQPTFMSDKIFSKVPVLEKVFRMLDAKGFYYFPLVTNSVLDSFWLLYELNNSGGVDDEIIVMLRNITKDISAQLSLLKAKEDRESALGILEQSQAAGKVGHYVVYLDEGRIETSSTLDQLLAVKDWSEFELKDWFERVHEDDRRMLAEKHMHILESSGAYLLRYRYQLEPNLFVWREVEAKISIEGGKRILRGTVRDVDEEQKYLEKVKKHAEVLEQIVKKTSHDIRAPLSRLHALILDLDSGKVMTEDYKQILIQSIDEVEIKLVDILHRSNDVLNEEVNDLNFEKIYDLEPEKEILIVDDDIIIRRIHQKIIEANTEFIPRIFASGNEVINYLKESFYKGKSSKGFLIFLDLNMPKGDGWDVLEFLKGSSFSDLEVVVVTSSIDERERSRAFTYGEVIKFISKPLREGDLKDLSINNAL